MYKNSNFDNGADPFQLRSIYRSSLPKVLGCILETLRLGRMSTCRFYPVSVELGPVLGMKHRRTYTVR